jgi:hypothetical protein
MLSSGTKAAGATPLKVMIIANEEAISSLEADGNDRHGLRVLRYVIIYTQIPDPQFSRAVLLSPGVESLL